VKKLKDKKIPNANVQENRRRLPFTGIQVIRQHVRLAGGWWLVLVCSERRVLLAGCWWLVCCERKILLAGG
jgi:hypothetical protein